MNQALFKPQTPGRWLSRPILTPQTTTDFMKMKTKTSLRLGLLAALSLAAFAPASFAQLNIPSDG
jgi:hypothetical protein